MGNTTSDRYIGDSKKAHKISIASIADSTGFEYAQVQTLWKRFCVLDGDRSGYISRNELMEQIKGFS